MDLLTLNNLKMYYHTLRGNVKAVDDIDLKMEVGDSVGLAGESGCGKTSTMLAVLRLQPRNATINGNVYLHGQDLVQMSEAEYRKEIRWRKISTIFQGAMNALHPTMTIGDQIEEAITLHEDVAKTEALERAEKLVELTGLKGSILDRYPHELSGGMKQRSVIAMSLACNPEIVIADEPTTALDVIVQAQVLKLMKDLQEKLGLSIIMITHDLAVIAEVCNKAAIMYAGKIVESGDIIDIFSQPLHPYTQALISAFPSVLGIKQELASIPGFPPDLIAPPPGCRFHPRCPYKMDICSKVEPSSTLVGQDHYVACHLVETKK